MEHLSKEAASELGLQIESAGTGDWHVGELADSRMRLAASNRGIDLTSRARQVQSEDFQDFDYIFTMDPSNFENTQKLCPDPGLAHKCVPFMNFVKKYEHSGVPDPYFGGPEGFEHVLDILEDGCQEILGQLKNDGKLTQVNG